MAIDHNNNKKKVPILNLELAIIFKSKKLQKKPLKFFKFILKKQKWPFTSSSGTWMTNLQVEIDEQEIWFIFEKYLNLQMIKTFFLENLHK